jgi:hypothetical protein
MAMAADDILLKHLQLHKPKYLLWQHAPAGRAKVHTLMRSPIFETNRAEF